MGFVKKQIRSRPGAWPFLVGGVICLVNSVNERDLNLLNSYANLAQFIGSLTFVDNFLEGLFASLANGSLRQKQVNIEDITHRPVKVD